MKNPRTIRPHRTPPPSRDSLARVLREGRENEAEQWRADSLRADLAALADYARTATGADAAAIALEENGAVICRARAGECAPATGAQLDPESGLSGLCLRTRAAVCCQDAEQDARVNIEVARSLGIRSMLAVPLVLDGRSIGLIEVFSSKPNLFGEEQAAALGGAGDLVLRMLGPERMAEEAGFIRALENICALDGRGQGMVSSTSLLELSHPVSRGGPAELAPQISVLDCYAEVERVEGKRILAVFATTVVLVIAAGLWVWRGTASASRPPRTGDLPAAARQAPEVASLLVRVNSGDPKAALALAHEYEQGGRLPRNPNAAQIWLQRAAEEGDSAAQYELAIHQLDGNGTAKDDVAALSWLQKSAHQGNSDAQLALGKAYAAGQGMQKDPIKAYACFALSGDAGNQDGEEALRRLSATLSRAQLAEARALVGRMYAAGVGVPVNNVSAYAWLKLAESTGSTKAWQDRAALTSKLSNSELAQATRRVEEWRRTRDR